MKELKFQCTLLSDVILNTKSATSGPNQTLDFIPGSNFLGIVASELYPKYAKASPDKAMTLFHSGKVRFGDAHPSKGNFRGLKVPAAMYYPKLSKPSEELYINHRIPSREANKELALELASKQLKQCRSGFYDFSGTADTPKDSPAAATTAQVIKTGTNFAIKSAYDRTTRRSKDEQLFGYQSLQKGLDMYFSVEIDDTVANPEEIAKEINKALIGNRRIGRSRTAQYGLVEIKPADYAEVKSQEPLTTPEGKLVTVYADSRLIFLDDYGMSTFQPTAEQLNLNGEVLWDKSQIRTFRYAPWNFKRQSFDTDRCGIEKGSVIVVRLNNNGADAPLHSGYVGAYNNEGFGRVIYNPSFLDADENGKAVWTLSTDDPKDKKPKEKVKTASTPLLEYLLSKKNEDTKRAEIYKIVNKWVTDHSKDFRGENFASQWGTIRSIAISSPDFHQLKRDLYENKAKGYLTHGVAKEKWAERKRLKNFEDFIKDLEDPGLKFNSSDCKYAIVNLAAEMAKKCKEK